MGYLGYLNQNIWLVRAYKLLLLIFFLGSLAIHSGCSNDLKSKGLAASGGNGMGYGGARNLEFDDIADYTPSDFEYPLNASFYRLSQITQCNGSLSHNGLIEVVEGILSFKAIACIDEGTPVTEYEWPIYNLDYIGYLGQGGIFEYHPTEPDLESLSSYNILWCRSSKDDHQGTDIIVKKTKSTAAFDDAELNFDFNRPETLGNDVSFSRNSTATYYNQDGVLTLASNNEMRFDYNPVDRGANGLLIESRSTNVVLRSKDFANAVWTRGNSTIQIRDEINPMGESDSQKLLAVNGSQNHYLETNLSFSSITPVLTLSMFVKPEERNQFALTVHSKNSSTYGGAAFQIGSSQLHSPIINNNGEDWRVLDSGIEGSSHGWYRVYVNLKVNPDDEFIYRIQLLKDWQPIYNDNNEGLLIYGAQAEPSSILSSYIPTQGQVQVRMADVITISTQASGSGSTQILFVEAQAKSIDSNQAQILGHWTDSAGQHRLTLGKTSNDNSTYLESKSTVSTSDYKFITDPGYQWERGTQQRIAVQLEQGSTNLFVNGSKIGEAQNSSSQVVYTQLQIGTDQLQETSWNGYIKRLAVWNTNLDDNKIAALAHNERFIYTAYAVSGVRVSESEDIFRKKKITAFEVNKRGEEEDRTLIFYSDAFAFGLYVQDFPGQINQRYSASVQATFDGRSQLLNMECRLEYDNL